MVNLQADGFLGKVKSETADRQWSSHSTKMKTPQLTVARPTLGGKSLELICSIPYKPRNGEETDHNSGGRRKKNVPRRSVHLNDSNYRGVYFTLETRILEGGEPSVVVTNILRVGLRCRRFLRQDVHRFCRRDEMTPKRTPPHRICRNRNTGERSQPPQHNRTSDSGISLLSDTDDDAINLSPDKRCLSCGTTKTPLWRGAEQGTALCNACGIRYKKYRARCVRCWHVPRRDQKVPGACTICGALVR